MDDNIINDLKENAKATKLMIKRNEFLKKIEGNEKILKKLSIERLKILERYYNNIIEKNNEKINKLKKIT